jgi:hypothetical protein
MNLSKLPKVEFRSVWKHEALGFTKPTNASTATIQFFERYKDFTIDQLEEVLQ